MIELSGKLGELKLTPSVTTGKLFVVQEMEIEYMGKLEPKQKFTFFPFKTENREVMDKIRYTKSEFITLLGWFSNDNESLYFEVKDIKENE